MANSFASHEIALLILMHDPIPALLGVAMVLASGPLRYFFFRIRQPLRATLLLLWTAEVENC